MIHPRLSLTLLMKIMQEHGLLPSFNPQHLLGGAATTDICLHQSTNDCTAWQDLAFA